MQEVITFDIWQYLAPLFYIILLGLIVSLFYGIVEYFTIDRVLKKFSGDSVLVVLSNEAYFGKLHPFPRSGGGFEIFFDVENIENPVSLLAFLYENYKETGDEKFLEEAETLIKEFKEKNILPESFTLKELRINPWYPPSLVSRKVFSTELGNVFGIFRFKDLLSEEERKKIWRELAVAYDPPLYLRASRKLSNSLSYVKDRVGSYFSSSTQMLQSTLMATSIPGVPIQTTTLSTDVSKRLQDMQSKILGTLGTEYDGLLENAIGRLVTVEVKDVEGEWKKYQGVLVEYSKKYILVYDVDYRIQMITKFRGSEEVSGFPKPYFNIYGLHMKWEKNLDAVYNWQERTVTFTNISQYPLKLEKLQVTVQTSEGDKLQDVAIGAVLFPGEKASAKLPENMKGDEYTVYYEISREADIIWPRSKVKVLGLGDYPADLLKTILTKLSRPHFSVK